MAKLLLGFFIATSTLATAVQFEHFPVSVESTIPSHMPFTNLRPTGRPGLKDDHIKQNTNFMLLTVHQDSTFIQEEPSFVRQVTNRGSSTELKREDEDEKGSRGSSRFNTRDRANARPSPVSVSTTAGSIKSRNPSGTQRRNPSKPRPSVSESQEYEEGEEEEEEEEEQGTFNPSRGRLPVRGRTENIEKSQGRKEESDQDDSFKRVRTGGRDQEESSNRGQEENENTGRGQDEDKTRTRGRNLQNKRITEDRRKTIISNTGTRESESQDIQAKSKIRISLSRGRENTPARSSLVEATTRAVRFETVQPTVFSIFPAVNPLDNNLLQSTPESFQVQSKPGSFRPNPRFLIEPEVGNTVDQEEIVDSLPEQRFQFFPAKTAEQKEEDDQLAQNEQLIQNQNQLILFPEDSAIHHAQLTWNQDPFRSVVSDEGKPVFNIDYSVSSVIEVPVLKKEEKINKPLSFQSSLSSIVSPRLPTTTLPTSKPVLRVSTEPVVEQEQERSLISRGRQTLNPGKSLIHEPKQSHSVGEARSTLNAIEPATPRQNIIKEEKQDVFVFNPEPFNLNAVRNPVNPSHVQTPFQSFPALIPTQPPQKSFEEPINLNALRNPVSPSPVQAPFQSFPAPIPTQPPQRSFEGGFEAVTWTPAILRKDFNPKNFLSEAPQSTQPRIQEQRNPFSNFAVFSQDIFANFPQPSNQRTAKSLKPAESADAESRIQAQTGNFFSLSRPAFSFSTQL